MPDREPIGVIGAGWVGLVTAACFAELGHEVHCRDIVQEKVDSLNRGEVPIYEPGLSELLEKNRDRLHFTTEMQPVLSGAELLFCCVDTPPTYSGDADLSRVERVVEELGDSRDHAIVMKSTVPVGTGRSIRRRREDLGYVSNPEFLKEGSAVADFMHPDRVVVGYGPESEPFGERVAALYEPLDCPIVRTDVASAEMVKLASNAFLATKISFINEIANVSEELGADVTEVARGMGLDERIGTQFLRAGIGYGGSCLVGEETVVIRRRGLCALVRLDELFEQIADEQDLDDAGTLEPDELEVLSWREGRPRPEFLAVSVLTRRHYGGDVVEVTTKMGRRVTATADHPFVVADARGRSIRTKLAIELDPREDWLPIAQGAPRTAVEDLTLEPLEGAVMAELQPTDVIVRPAGAEIAALATAPRERWVAGLDHPRGVTRRRADILRSGAMRLHEAGRLGVSTAGGTALTARNGTAIPFGLGMDDAFWRIVGLYLAEGHVSAGHRIHWSFHPTRETDLVEEVRDFWQSRGVKASVFQRPTATEVRVSSRLLVGWWEGLGLGRNGYEQRIPDAAWSQDEAAKRALVVGMWRGDGSWSYVRGGPSVVLEYGTISRELADGLLRLLGDLGIVARLKVGRTAKSTADTHWLVVSGADQVERMLDCVREEDRLAIRDALALQAKRIAPSGYRRHGHRNAAWARVAKTERRAFSGPVYSMEVPDAHTFVTTGGLTVHNCFPKDVSALKQLAGNTGYHFQLLTAVIEVNELQKRRTIGKLQKHLGSLVGKEIALLGVAFKPNTDDIREATSLVLAARLQSEGAHVRVYDPIASPRASEMLGGAKICDSAVEALDGADGAVLVTEWPEFRELDWAGEVKERMARPLVVDGRNFLDAPLLHDAGYAYEGIGRR
ncbi:MAG: nucleotide sugar dehydrogenase [Actinomycetota bacterium]|nr:nucleotide sugar dehydrogenase [Actinomycetota bacterium]